MNGVLSLRYLNSDCFNCVIHIEKHARILYLVNQLELSEQPISVYSDDSIIEIRMNSYNDFWIKVPIVKLPISIDSLPFNSDLGVTLPPVCIHFHNKTVYSEC